jgi:hypothetical protein
MMIEHYAKVRAETARLLGYGDDIDGLTPEQSTRLDIASALRVAVDDLTGRVIRGESTDVSKLLSTSEALARLLPPTVLATPPSEQREDHEAAVAPLLKLFRYLHETVHTLSAENARLRTQLGLAPALPDVSLRDNTNPTEVVPPNEIGACHVGVKPGPDDPPPRSTTIIEARPNPPAAPATPKYDYDKEQGWRDHVLPDGTITPTPMSRGRWWGPV